MLAQYDTKRVDSEQQEMNSRMSQLVDVIRHQSINQSKWIVLRQTRTPRGEEAQHKTTS